MERSNVVSGTFETGSSETSQSSPPLSTAASPPAVNKPTEDHALDFEDADDPPLLTSTLKQAADSDDEFDFDLPGEKKTNGKRVSFAGEESSSPETQDAKIPSVQDSQCRDDVFSKKEKEVPLKVTAGDVTSVATATAASAVTSFPSGSACLPSERSSTTTAVQPTITTVVAPPTAFQDSDKVGHIAG
jgi:hypothetical protein